MNIEVIVLWGVLPAMLAVLSIMASIHSFCRDVSIAQACLVLPVVAGMGLSLWAFYDMFIEGAWPTYIPHIAIGILTPVALGQVFVARRRSSN